MPKEKSNKDIISMPEERIIGRIFLIRGKKVMLSGDLADLYNVEIRALNQAVKRNYKRFPPDFMFQLNKSELTNLKSQFVISSWGWVKIRTLCIYRTRHSNVVLRLKGQNSCRC